MIEMFEVKDDLTIYCTRGDVVMLSVTADENGVNYIFQPGDVVRMKVFEKKDCQCVVMQKDVIIEETTDKVDILLTGQETRICEVISKPKDFWYEVELNPETNPQTIIGYDEDGPKVFKMFPEGKELEDIEERDLPFVEELRAEMKGIKSDAEKSADIADKRAVDAANSVTAASDMAEISRQNAVAAANSSSQASLFEQAAADDAANASAAADNANTAAQRSQTAANDAFAAKNSALEAAARSAESEKNALEAAERAESYSINPPYPDNEVWHIWNGTEYVATNEPSRGEKGDKGDQGIQGVKGDKGDQGVKGDTGATGADGKDGKDGVVDYSLVANALKGNASGEVISLDDVSSLSHNLGVKVQSKNLYDINNFTSAGSGSYAWYAIGDFPWRLTLLDKDTSVDISGLDLGIALYTKGPVAAYSWFVEGGNIKKSTKDNFADNVENKKHIRCDSLFVYPNTQECIDKLNQRFAIMVTVGDDVPTEYAPYVDVEQTKVLARGKNLFNDLAFYAAHGYEKQKDGSWHNPLSVDTAIEESLLIPGYTGQYTLSIDAKNDQTDAIERNPLWIQFNYTDGSKDYFQVKSKEWQHYSLTSAKGKTISTIEWSYGTKNSPHSVKNAMFVADNIEAKYEPFSETEYPVNADGTVEGVQSISPNMTITSDTANVLLSAQYNKDTNKVIEKLINRIAALESAVI